MTWNLSPPIAGGIAAELFFVGVFLAVRAPPRFAVVMGTGCAVVVAGWMAVEELADGLPRTAGGETGGTDSPEGN